MTPLSLEGLLELAGKATGGPLKLDRYEHGGGRLYREEPRTLVADLFNEGDREFHAACSPEVVRALVRVAQAVLAERKMRRSMDEFWTEDKSDQYDIASEELAAALGEIEGVVK